LARSAVFLALDFALSVLPPLRLQRTVPRRPSGRLLRLALRLLRSASRLVADLTHHDSPLSVFVRSASASCAPYEIDDQENHDDENQGSDADVHTTSFPISSRFVNADDARQEPGPLRSPTVVRRARAYPSVASRKRHDAFRASRSRTSSLFVRDRAEAGRRRQQPPKIASPCVKAAHTSRTDSTHARRQQTRSAC
jgi:hypothetical protein